MLHAEKLLDAREKTIMHKDQQVKKKAAEARHLETLKKQIAKSIDDKKKLSKQLHDRAKEQQSARRPEHEAYVERPDRPRLLAPSQLGTSLHEAHDNGESESTNDDEAGHD